MRILLTILLLSTLAFAGRRFNGTTDTISVPGNGTSIDLNNEMTMSVWFNPSVYNSTEQDLVSKWGTTVGNQYELIFNYPTSGKVTAAWKESGVPNQIINTCGTTLTVANVWHHLAATWSVSGGVTSLYLDGSQCIFVSTHGPLISNGHNLILGASDTGTLNPTSAILAEVCIYNVALGNAEIASMAKGTPCSRIRTTALAGYWPMTGAGSSVSLTSLNLDQTHTGWQYAPPCVGPSCAGGTGTATVTSYTLNNATPSLDGNSGLFSFTCSPNCGSLTSGQTTNVLWPWKQGANNNYTNFLGTYNIYIPSITNITALEFDQFQFNGGQRYMMGSECDKSGNWRIWNQLTGSWVSTSVACTIFVANTWHSIVWATHRIPGDTSCASSMPCMYYDSLIVDGVAYSGFTQQPSGTSADADNNGIQFQIDQDFTAGTSSVYMDQMSLTTSVPGEPDASGNHNNGTVIGTTVAQHCPCNPPAGGRQ